MLYYIEAGISGLEIPGERSLCIYISGCENRCRRCHFPELQRKDWGDPLHQNFRFLVEAYAPQATCVCFLGEGANGEEERREFLGYTCFLHRKGLKSGLYSGRDTGIEPWMRIFDYVKTGSYRPERGALDSHTTNQRMAQKILGQFVDITDRFWRG